ncbi:MAG TPA: hypothetical protein VMB91_08495 [Solirubrobacteraceae bacterium]|nr:hypothetical protein [Solirubrobacteraceae bacterium]
MQPTEHARPAGRPALVAAALCAALLLTVGLLQGCPSAQAARGRPAALPRSAGKLVGIVRHSARASGRARPNGVVRIRCCGQRTLAVYYRAHPSAGRPWHGTYELRLRRRGRFLESVGIAFFPTAARWSYGGGASGEGPRYELSITSPRGRRGWRLNVSASYFSCPPPPSAGPSAAAQCEGFSDALALGERQLGARRLHALLHRALGFVRKARRRVPISGADVAAASEAVRAATATAAVRARN